MSRGYVKNNILDGALGAQGPAATGIFGAVGVAAIPNAGILILTDPADAAEKLGDGPLRDLVVSALAVAATTCYVVPLAGSIAGVVSAIAKDAAAAGVGTLTAAGSPRNAYDVTVKIEGAGGLNEAIFRYEIDGVLSKQITVPLDGEYEIPNTGLTLTFSAGVPAGGEESFEVGDEFTFSTTAPSASNTEILSGIDRLLESAYAFEWISVAGISDSALWAALAVKASGAEAVYRYIHFKAQARYLADGESVDEWVAALTGDERGLTVGGRVQVYAAWIEESDPMGAVDRRGAIGLGSGMSARRNVHEPVDALKYGGVSGVNKLLPAGINGGHIDALDNAGYVTLTTYVGRTGAYITHGRMFAEETSDYQLEERRRVMDLACARVRSAQMNFLNDTIEIAADGSMEGIKMFHAISEQPLRDMAAAGIISSGEVLIDENQNILSTETVLTRVRIVPLGKMSYIENTISFHNPAIGGEEE